MLEFRRAALQSAIQRAESRDSFCTSKSHFRSDRQREHANHRKTNGRKALHSDSTCRTVGDTSMKKSHIVVPLFKLVHESFFHSSVSHAVIHSGIFSQPTSAYTRFSKSIATPAQWLSFMLVPIKTMPFKWIAGRFNVRTRSSETKLTSEPKSKLSHSFSSSLEVHPHMSVYLAVLVAHAEVVWSCSM